MSLSAYHLHVEPVSVVVGNEFETVDIASFSSPPELPEVMKSAEESNTDMAKSE